MKKRMLSVVMVFAVCVVVCYSMISYAEKNTMPYNYAGYQLTCYINCTRFRGEGSTAGAEMNGRRNYVKTVTYDIDQEYLDDKSVYSIKKAEAIVTKGFPYLTDTFHAVTDMYGNQLLPAYKQYKQTKGR